MEGWGGWWEGWGGWWVGGWAKGCDVVEWLLLGGWHGGVGDRKLERRGKKDEVRKVRHRRVGWLTTTTKGGGVERLAL